MSTMSYPPNRYKLIPQRGKLFLDEWEIRLVRDESRDAGYLAQVQLSRVWPDGGHQTEWLVVYDLGADAPTAEILAKALLLSGKGWVIRKHRFILRRKISKILKNMELTA